MKTSVVIPSEKHVSEEKVALLPIQKLIMNSHKNRNDIMKYQLPHNFD